MPAKYIEDGYGSTRSGTEQKKFFSCYFCPMLVCHCARFYAEYVHIEMQLSQEMFSDSSTMLGQVRRRSGFVLGEEQHDPVDVKATSCPRSKAYCH